MQMPPSSRGSEAAAAPLRFRRMAMMLPLVVVVIGLAGFALCVAERAYGLTDTTDLLRASLASLALGSGAVLLWRVALVSRYRPLDAPDDAALPSLTVIVPAFNEGRQVYETLRSIVASDYPRARLEVIAVDDGSQDDTWLWIERARRDFETEAVRCPENRGKRHALYEGFGRARGEVIVTIDSDSEVRPDTLRNLVAPLVADAEVGAVAGAVRVLNRHAPIPRMLDVSFTYSFEFIRASESVLGAVVCCPGALSAYRRDLVDRVKDAWLAQRVLGRPANIGEDRALTNQVLRNGYRVVFQSNAVVYTDVPTTYAKLWRMLLRWARSNVRETVVLGSFVFGDFRRRGKLGIRLLFAHHAVGMMVAGASFVPSLVASLLHPALVLWVAAAALFSASIPSVVYAFCRRPDRCLWGFAYGLMATFGLTWITPFALLTPHRTGWLTRGAEAPSLAPDPVG